MEIVASHASVIVPEVLKRYNYKRWSIFMQHYLVGQGLWDVVQLKQLPVEENIRSEWIKKNALALHAIMISCGKEMFDQIKEMNFAKDVWDTLADMHKPQENFEHRVERRTGPGNLESSQYETLTKAISNGELWEVEKFFKENPNARSARIFENGYTALHFAVYNGNEEIADYLIKSDLSQEELEKKDDFGGTALSIAARCEVGKSIAQKLVRVNDNLLVIPDNDGKIPVQLACSTIDEDMTRYLYGETPLEFLKGDCGFYILQECIARKMFDIAFDLLYHFPEFASRSCSSGSNPVTPLILTLAQTPPPFFRGSNLSFWGLWIYDCIRVKTYVIKEDGHRSWTRKIQDFYQSCRAMVKDCFQPCGETFQEHMLRKRKAIPEIRKKIQEMMINKSFKGLCVMPLGVLVMSVSLIGMLARITLSMPLILVKLILVALRILVSMLSSFLGTHLYQLKLMDEYASKVIHLLCQPQNQFVQSRAVAVEATFQAIKNGIPIIVKEITKANPNILWSSTDPADLRSRNLFACAVAHRQEEVARCLYESAKEEKKILFTIDEDGNNILHLAAKLPFHYQLGYKHAASFQLLSELRWFKAVKTIVPRSFNGQKNEDNKSPLEVFFREHKDLLTEVDKWVKKTAESLIVVGALIITTMFAVAFTVPGGNDEKEGFPIFLRKAPIPFMVFVVSDGISLFAAASSVLMFCGILTSPHFDKDYHKSFLLIIAHISLFVSIATMAIAFCAALFTMGQDRFGAVILIPMTLLAGIFITCYMWLLLPPLVEILVLTFRPNIFGKKETSWMSRMTDLFN